MSLKSMQVSPKDFNRSHLKFYIILVPVAIFMLLPVVYIFSQAFKPISELMMFPPRFLVQQPTTQNFTDLLRAASGTGVPMTRYLVNSIFVDAMLSDNTDDISKKIDDLDNKFSALDNIVKEGLGKNIVNIVIDIEIKRQSYVQNNC